MEEEGSRGTAIRGWREGSRGTVKLVFLLRSAWAIRLRRTEERRESFAVRFVFWLENDFGFFWRERFWLRDYC
ncbi:hypothetical protein SO802_023854 [Lithocarpus litseifolius]|uniref:Uncharacterized protein n=1 Tax=Lithocarpus litseifolius TaxID=425828 RepID=A0AAW2C8M5_9ROSI